jgi:hypothetical protein
MSLRPASLVLPLFVAAALAGCSAEPDPALRKEIDDLKADVQRTQKENDRLTARLASMEHRVNGLSLELPHGAAPGRASETVAAAEEAPVSESPGAVAPSATPDGPAIRAFLATEEGRKTLSDAIQAEREQREREQQKRRVDAMVDRFARDAGLAEDQTKKMKDILGRSASQVREIWSTVREAGEVTAEQREALRQQNTAKMQELNQKTDEEVRNVLSSAQFEVYQQQQDRLRSTIRGGGVTAPGGANGRRPATPPERNP